MDPSPADQPVPVRRVRFTWPDDFDPNWAPSHPELAAAANAVSLLMPYVEPYIVGCVRSEASRLADSGANSPAETLLVGRAQAYAAQEAQHHAQHRRFNDLLVASRPELKRVERLTRWTMARLRRRSTRFGLAYAAAFETMAFVAARWVDRHLSLLRGAEPRATTFFLWHLAEEVEHKEVAFDVYEASGGGRLRYAGAAVVAATMLSGLSWLGCLSLLAGQGRLWNPLAHLRLARWSLSFVFAALPVLVLSALPGHHPRDLVDPAGLEHWLDHLDTATATVPEWALP